MLLHLAEDSPEPMKGQIARQLRSKILDGDLPEGCRLGDTRRTAREQRVSAGPLREALEELAREGLVMREEAGGFRVGRVSAEQRRELTQRRLMEGLRGEEAWMRELELARDVQRRLLPPARVEGNGFVVSSRSLPARVVSGDFHDVLTHADGTVGVIVGDVVGKGLGASLVMASVKAMASVVAGRRGVADTLRELNRRLAVELGRELFVALAYARVVPGLATVELANAGMPDPFLVTSEGRVTALEVAGPRLPLGVLPDVPYVSTTRRLQRGERLLLFSDGIPEARRPAGGTLGYERFEGILTRTPPAARDGEVWLEAVLEAVESATCPCLDDDWTAVAVELRRPGGE